MFVSKKMFTNWVNISLPLETWVKKTVHGVEAHWLSSKEKVPGSAISKEGQADSFLDYEMISIFLYTKCFRKIDIIS